MVLIGFGAVLVFAWLCYAPAISGAFQLDDYTNLGGLAKVEDTHSAIDFISSGIAGPTGRPLALASFALQADEWRQGPSALLRVNILIHLANAILLAVSLYQLSLQRSVARHESALVAVVAASLWVLMPLLATASLLIVQRMTTLSAMFMLLGLCGYLYARAQIEREPKWALLSMSVSVITGTVLATFCKESGLLLPILVLVLETTVLERPGGVKDRDWRTWQLIFLVAPLALLLLYLVTWISYPDELIARRGFTAWERLITENRILWVYLSKAIVGIPSQLGIYQYPPMVSRSLFDPATLLSCFAWLALLIFSIMRRRRYPLFAVSVLWYLGGHVLESTVVPLELYFEHRNYMPVIGPLFGLASFLVLSPARRNLVPRALVLVLGLVNAWFLYSFSSLSGQPSIAARYWANVYPESRRAVTSVAMYRLEEEGLLPAVQTIESFVTAKPEYAHMRLLQLNLLCQYAPKQDQRWVLDRLERDLPAVGYVRTAPLMLFELLNTTSRRSCNAVDAETVASLATVLRDNPRYESEPSFNRDYHKLLAEIAHRRGQYEEEIDHLRRALTYWPTSNLNAKMVRALIDADDFDRAREFINESRDLAPANPIMAMRWQRDLESLHKYVREKENEHDAAQTEQMGGDKGRP
jgi:tetratricopeptide (TPR) repeat protein